MTNLHHSGQLTMPEPKLDALTKREGDEQLMEWWETDTSATVKIVCKVCGTLRTITSNLAATDGVKELTLEGYCDKHSVESEREEQD